jgi:hypothetical protein
MLRRYFSRIPAGKQRIFCIVCISLHGKSMQPVGVSGMTGGKTRRRIMF